MKVAIVGSRGYSHLSRVEMYVKYSLDKDDVVVSGGAVGVDTSAELAAQERFEEGSMLNPPLIFPADWATYGKSAGFVRNRVIVENADKVVAFWDGKSKGTMNTIHHAKNLDKPYVIYGPDGTEVSG